MKVGVCGNRSYGTWRCRGEPLVRAFGWNYLPIDRSVKGQYDVILLIKRSLQKYRFPVNLRQSTRVLVCDPLDWWVSPQKERPHILWRRFQHALKPDHIISTSPAAAAVLRVSVPESQIWTIPHAADPRISTGWYNPEGPVVYVGGRVYFQKLKDLFQEACRQIGRQFRVYWSSHDPSGLKGAALQVCVRDSRHSTWFNNLCKPQIKLANSAAAGMPAVCNGTPAELSLYPDAATITHDDMKDVEALSGKVQVALNGPRLSDPYTQAQYLKDMKALINQCAG